MRRLTAWIGGIAGGVVAYRFWHRHQQAAPEPYPQPVAEEPDDRAEELRAKLAESREVDSAAEPAEAEKPPLEPEPTAEPAGQDPPESPEERRQRVHDEGRAALDEMKPD
jgi:hypothetical protein